MEPTSSAECAHSLDVRVHIRNFIVRMPRVSGKQCNLAVPTDRWSAPYLTGKQGRANNNRLLAEEGPHILRRRYPQ